MPSTPLSRAEFIAMGELAKARRQLVVNMFGGTRLKFGSASTLSTGKSLLSSGKSLKSDVSKLAKGGSTATKVASVPGMKEAFENFMVECADVENIHDVIEAIGGEVLHELVSEVTPYLGVVTSTVKLAKAGKAVAQDGYNLYKSDEYKNGFRMGDPSAAAEAIQAIIKRDLAQHSVKLGQQTVATGAKIGGLFADFGTATTAAIGVANTLASLGLLLFSLGLDIKDMRAGNKRLAAPNTLDLTVFNECPILGCYLLTCADIAGTSAKLWNSWKDKLLSDLYVSTRYALRAGLEKIPHAGERADECRREARAILREGGMDAATIERVWADFPDESFLRFTPAQIAWQTRGIAQASADGLHVLVEAKGPRGGTEVFVHATDRDGLFAAITAVFDRLRLSVLEARVVTSRSGMSLDSFVVLDGEGRALRDAAQAARLRNALAKALAQTPYRVEAALHAPSRVQRHFPIAAKIEFGAQPASGHTQLAIVCADRPGLLAAIARVFREQGVRVHDARIATFGERVEDFFLIGGVHDAILDAAACAALQKALALILDFSMAGKRHA